VPQNRTTGSADARTPRGRFARRLGGVAVTAGLAGVLLAPPAAGGASDDGTLLDPHPARLVGCDLYLGISVNGQATSTLARFRLEYGRLYMPRADLKALVAEYFDRLTLPEPPPRAVAPGTGEAVAGEDLIALDSVRPLRYRYNASEQVVEISAPPEVTTARHLGVRTPETLRSSAATGLSISYDALYTNTPSSRAGGALALWSEDRIFGDWGIAANTGTVNLADGLGRYTRLDTSWQYDDVPDRVSWRAGDTTSSSLAWTRAVHLAGLQVGRNFALTPYQVPFPLPSVSGSAAVPSAVDLYINGIHQYTGETPAGAFDVGGVAPITGAGIATVVVRDPVGREVATSVPVYVDTRLLVAGLSSFSGELGTFRRDYGAPTTGYGGGLVGSGTLRLGLSNALTLEAHAEGTSNLALAGIGGLIELGTFGVLNGSITGSTGGGARGGQFTIGYQGLFPRISVSAQSQRSSAAFRDLAAASGLPAPRATDQATVSCPVTPTATLGLSVVRESGDAGATSRVGSFYGSAQIGRHLSVFASGYREFERGGTSGAWLGLSMVLGDRRSGTASSGKIGGRSTYAASLTQAADYSGGFESSFYVNRADGLSSGTARLGYLGRVGEVSAAVQHVGGQDAVALDANGGLVLMDGVVAASRRLTDSFALVSTDGVAGIPVLHENRLIGATDSTGHLLVPDLLAYQHNDLKIDTLTLPADARVDTPDLDVVPKTRAGALAHFPVLSYNAVTLRVAFPDGAVLPTGSRLLHRESGRVLVVGYDGIVFVEDVAPHNRLVLKGRSGDACLVSFDFTRRAADRTSIVDLGALTCQAMHEARRD